MNKKYEPLDITGDVGLKAYGKTVDEVFINAAVGMYSLITNLNLIQEKKTINISVENSSIEELFVSWLNELIFHFDTYGFIGKRISITEITPSLSPRRIRLSAETLPPRGGELGGWTNQPAGMQVCTLKAAVSGEEFDTERHERKLLIKAATYHKLKIEKVGDIWQAEVIFDI